jgi:hypothetical protein
MKNAKRVAKQAGMMIFVSGVVASVIAGLVLSIQMILELVG